MQVLAQQLKRKGEETPPGFRGQIAIAQWQRKFPEVRAVRDCSALRWASSERLDLLKVLVDQGFRPFTCQRLYYNTPRIPV